MKKIICLFVFSFGFFLGSMFYYENDFYPRIQKINEETTFQVMSGVEDSIDAYRAKFNNSDIVGEISILNSSFKAPFAKGNDNSFYSNHLLDKSFNRLGSIYLDYRNNLLDSFVFIYGNNCSSNFSFHVLESFLDFDFFNDHSSIFINDGSVSEYKIFSVFVSGDDFRYIDSYNLDSLKSNSIYDTGVLVSPLDNVLVLQTDFDDFNIILCAKKI